MKVKIDNKLKTNKHFSDIKLKHAHFYPLVKDRMFRLMFSKNNKNFVSFFLSSLFNLDYDYVYNNIRINNNVLTNDTVNEVSKTVDFICEVDEKLYIIEMNNQAKLSTLRRNKIYLYKVLGSYIKLNKKKGKHNGTDEEKKLKKYKCIYLVNINNFYPSTAIDTLDKEETVIKRKDILVSYGKDYEVYDIYLPLLNKLWYTYSKQNTNIRKLEKWEEFLLISLLDDSEKLQEIIKKEEIYMDYRNKAREISKEDDLDFAWASIEADEYQRELDLEEAEEHGKNIGIAEGKTIGIAEGVEKTKIETAKKLYDSNVSIDIIKTATGFSEKQIKNICL